MSAAAVIFRASRRGLQYIPENCRAIAGSVASCLKTPWIGILPCLNGVTAQTAGKHHFLNIEPQHIGCCKSAKETRKFDLGTGNAGIRRAARRRACRHRRPLCRHGGIRTGRDLRLRENPKKSGITSTARAGRPPARQLRSGARRDPVRRDRGGTAVRTAWGMTATR